VRGRKKHLGSRGAMPFRPSMARTTALSEFNEAHPPGSSCAKHELQCLKRHDPTASAKAKIGHKRVVAEASIVVHGEPGPEVSSVGSAS
jgi:hypothetical protein